MYKFNQVNKTVAPKREAQRQALEALAATQRTLANAKAKLKEVEERIATLQAKYDDSVRKKADLEIKVRECQEKLTRAGKVFFRLFSMIFFNKFKKKKVGIWSRRRKSTLGREC
jgi:dynein heavy chain